MRVRAGLLSRPVRVEICRSAAETKRSRVCIPRADTRTSRSTISATASTDMPLASHCRGSCSSTVRSTWSWLRMEVRDSSVTEATMNWKILRYWWKVKL